MIWNFVQERFLSITREVRVIDRTDIEIRKVIVNKIPEGCGGCPLMMYLHDTEPVCVAIPCEYWEIQGNPYSMKYRRSDCPLTLMP